MGPGRDRVSTATAPGATIGLMPPQNGSSDRGYRGGTFGQLDRPTLAPTPTGGLLLLTPVWQAVAPAAASATYATSERVLLAGASDHEAWSRILPQAVSLGPPRRRHRHPHQEIDRTWPHWPCGLGRARSRATSASGSVPWSGRRNRVCFEVFRLVKALAHPLNYGVRDMTWTLITRDTQPVLQHDVINPTHAALHGLVGSIARNIRTGRCACSSLEAGVDLPIETLLSQPADPGGDIRSYRDGNWYRQG